MTVGTKTYMDMAVPLQGESEIRQITAATDILTITRITSGTGDYLVCRDDGGTEAFAVTKEGRIQFRTNITTAPSTALTKGELFLIFSTSSPVLAVCTSTAGNTMKYISPFDTKTIMRTT